MMSQCTRYRQTGSIDLAAVGGTQKPDDPNGETLPDCFNQTHSHL